MNDSKIKIEYWELSRFIPYDRNPRKHDHEVKRLAQAVQSYGFMVPVIAKSNGQLVDGHMRLKAAREAGIKQVPVVLADDLNEQQIKAFRISINRMSELAEWDDELLWEEMRALELKGYDLDLTGFLAEERTGIQTAGKISDPFSIPATTILDARKGEWQDRKRIWNNLGIKSELGRGRADE